MYFWVFAVKDNEQRLKHFSYQEMTTHWDQCQQHTILADFLKKRIWKDWCSLNMLLAWAGSTRVSILTNITLNVININFSVERAWSALTRRYSDLILDPDDTLHSEEDPEATTKPTETINVGALNKILDITEAAAEKFTFDG